jgi:hypothetical protein
LILIYVFIFNKILKEFNDLISENAKLKSSLEGKDKRMAEFVERENKNGDLSSKLEVYSLFFYFIAFVLE